MIVRELDKIVVDVSQTQDGQINYQGAVYIYQRYVIDGQNRISIDPQSESVAPEQAVQLLGASAGKFVARVDELENQIQTEREQAKATVDELNAEIERLNKALAAENLTNQQLTAVVKAVKTAIGS